MILSWLKKFNISNTYIAVQIEIGWQKPLEDRELQDWGHFVAMKTVVADVITVYINIAGFENRYKLIRSSGNRYLPILNHSPCQNNWYNLDNFHHQPSAICGLMIAGPSLSTSFTKFKNFHAETITQILPRPIEVFAWVTLCEKSLCFLGSKIYNNTMSPGPQPDTIKQM